VEVVVDEPDIVQVDYNEARK